MLGDSAVKGRVPDGDNEGDVDGSWVGSKGGNIGDGNEAFGLIKGIIGRLGGDGKSPTG